MKSIDAIKTLFQRKDSISPEGGRLVTTHELIELTKSKPGAAREMAEMCAKELGLTLEN